MIKISNFYGFIIKKEALIRASINLEQLSKIMESSPIDQDVDLISFGPSFGAEAAKNLSKRLESKGLVYVDDYFIFEGDFPEWLSFKVSKV